MSIRRRIHLYGYLRDICPDVIELTADTVAEAINGLQKVKRGLFQPNAIEGTRPTIKVLGFDTVESLTAKSDVQDLHIVPAFSGGKSGWVSILVGAVLIAAAFIPGVGEAIAGATFGLFGASNLALIGTGLVLGGLTQTLFPVKLADQQLDQNNYLGSPQNTVKIGTRIPLLFGTCLAYGQFLSYNVAALNLNA